MDENECPWMNYIMNQNTQSSYEILLDLHENIHIDVFYNNFTNYDV